MGNMVFLVPAAGILALAIIIKAILDNLGNIKRTTNDTSDTDREYPKIILRGSRLITNLKWGFILAGLGFALLLKEYTMPKLSDGGTFGLMFLCAGFSFFVYYAIAKKAMDKKEDHEPSNE